MTRADNFLIALRPSGLADLRQQLEADPSLVQLQYDSATPLHLATNWEMPEVARLLIEHGADINARGEAGRTALHDAARWHRIPMLRLLLELGADVNVRDEDGWTPLHIAGQDWCPSPDGVKTTKILLENGADPNAEDIEGCRPLHVLRSGMRQAVYLLAHGAQVNARNNRGQTPLHQAAVWSGPCIPVLLRNGAEVNAHDEWLGATPLHYAVGHHTFPEDHAKRLLLGGADPNARDHRGRTPLHVAALCRCFAGAHVLLEMGAEVNAQDSTGRIPLDSVGKGTYDTEDSDIPPKSQLFKAQVREMTKILKQDYLSEKSARLNTSKEQQ